MYYFFDFDVDALLKTIELFQKRDSSNKIFFDDLKQKIFKTKNERILYYYYGKNQFSILPSGNEEFIDLDILMKENKFYLPEDAYFILKVNRTEEGFEISLKEMSKWLYEKYERYISVKKKHIEFCINVYFGEKIFEILTNKLKMIFNYKLSYAKKSDVSDYWKNKFRNILLESIMQRTFEIYDKITLIYFYKLKNPIPIIPNWNVEFVNLDEILDSIEHKKNDKFCLPEDTYITLSIIKDSDSYGVKVEDFSKWLDDELYDLSKKTI